MESKKELRMAQNNRDLENAKSVGYAMEDTANDIKLNLAAQSDKM